MTKTLVRKDELIQVEGTKKGRNQKITLVEEIKKDISIKKVTESIISDRI